MSVFTGIKRLLNTIFTAEKNSSEAYDAWACGYDDQPGNLMLDLDAIIFNRMFEQLEVKGKLIVDIGCGTGRHWHTILSKEPARLTGFDVSKEMLKKLRQKFQNAEVIQTVDDILPGIPDASYDILISTLTVAHIKEIEPAVNAWCRILKKNAEVIITDFHPQLLMKGGKRTFRHNEQLISITNFIHTVPEIKSLFYQNGFKVVDEEERNIDEQVKEYYVKQNAIHVYEKFKGSPVIYGLQLKRSDGNK